MVLVYDLPGFGLWSTLFPYDLPGLGLWSTYPSHSAEISVFAKNEVDHKPKPPKGPKKEKKKTCEKKKRGGGWEGFGLWSTYPLLSGTGDSRRHSRESIRANHSQLKCLFLWRVRPIRAIHSNFWFAWSTPLRPPGNCRKSAVFEKRRSLWSTFFVPKCQGRS